MNSFFGRRSGAIGLALLFAGVGGYVALLIVERSSEVPSQVQIGVVMFGGLMAGVGIRLLVKRALSISAAKKSS